MADPIKELDKQAQERVKEQERLAGEIAGLEKNIEAVKEKAQTAAAAGDLDGYKAAQAEAGALEDQLTVSKAHLQKLKTTKPITQGQASLAWQGFSAAYNKEFDKKYSQFLQALEKVFSFYEEILNMQGAAFDTRERIASYTDMDTKAMSAFDRPLDVAFPCKCLPDGINDISTGPRLSLPGTVLKDPVALFYLAHLMDKSKGTIRENADNPTIRRVMDILSRHTTKPFI